MLIDGLACYLLLCTRFKSVLEHFPSDDCSILVICNVYIFMRHSLKVNSSCCLYFVVMSCNRLEIIFLLLTCNFYWLSM